MKNIPDFQLENDFLLKKWRIESDKDDSNGFCEDGLMFKGEIKTTIGNDNKKYWYRESGNENILWYNSAKRVLFLNKDVPGNNEQNIREWIFRQHPTDITNKHYKNISLWLYGLLNLNNEGISPLFDDISVLDYSSFTDKTPLAYINCKKECGFNSISNKMLSAHIERFKIFIKSQIYILNPDIIVCGGGSSLIKNFIKEFVYKDIVQVNAWMYFDKKNNKLIIDSYHPSCRKSPNDIYEPLMKNYEDFNRKFPKFNNI